ncbi:MAG: hypothetical protein M3P06_19065 [Acidobacteriota bacterium]|nr:hypothetical protein [Acidobacteriota bacterium]
MNYALDHLRSSRLITDSSGDVLDEQNFDPFGGGGLFGSGALQFTGHERDQANIGAGTFNLPDYMHARFYDKDGRFLSVDPVLDIKNAVAGPQQWNRYNYASNNPIRNVDPDGRAIEPYEAIATYAGIARNAAEHMSALPNGEGLRLAASLLGTVERTMRLGDATGAALGSNKDGIGLAMAISSDVAIASEAFVTLGGAAAGVLEGRAAAVGATAGTTAGRCVQCAQTFIAENAGATPIRAANYNHWAARTRDGTKIFDPTLRGNLKALGKKYRDINPRQKYFTPEEWERLTQRLADIARAR